MPVARERRRNRFAFRTTSAITSAAVATSSLMSSVAYALPQGGSVVEGDATITYGENSVTIAQNSAHVIIEWDSFDTAAGESVHFDQAEFMAALNRILSGQATRFDGVLTGAGSITIVNQAGIAFGAGANIDVGAITATTLDIINSNFMADNLVFDQYDSAFADASVTNAGTITVADQGLAALVGPGVANNGLIQARTGAVVLASGTAATIDFYGDGLVNFAVTGATEAAPVDADGNPLDALVSNSGAIYADGGTVILAAEAVGGIVDHAINMDGVIQAQSIAGRNGQIALVAGDGAGDVQVAGTLDASGADAGTTGGTVHVLGDTVALNAGADVNVSGNAGGGQALVGGSYQGGENVGSGIQYTRTDSVTTIIADPAFDAGGYVPTSDITYVAEGAGINVSATDNGNAGSAYVWGDQAAAFYGTVTARGGANGGNGGFVEISSAGALGYAGAVDTSAAQGETGRLLLDPQNVLLGTVNPILMGLNILADAASGGTFPVLVIDQQALANTLYSTDVDLWASNSIVTLEAIDVSTARGVVVGNTPFSPPGCWNIFGCAIFGDAITTNDLTLSAPTVSILHDFTLGTGNLEVADLLAGTSIIGLGFISAPTDIIVDTLNLNGQIHMRSTVGGATSLASDAQINTDAGIINILSNAAQIQQGIHFAQAGATVNVGAGIYAENLLLERDIDLVGSVDGGGAPTTVLAPVSGTGLLIDGSGSIAPTDIISISNFEFAGDSSNTTYGLFVDSSAVFAEFNVDNSEFHGWTRSGYFQEGDSTTGQGVDQTNLSNLSFYENGQANGGGTGDINFWEFNENASLTNLTLVGSFGTGSDERSGIQFRGVGAGDGTGVMNAGTVSFNNVDITGTYRTQMIGIQRYLDVSNFSFTDVALGGATSGITGTFGASLRFDGVGDILGNSTIDLGNTHFRGHGALGALGIDIEFAPDNNFAFLTADATGTMWDANGTVDSRAEGFAAADRVLDGLEIHPVHGAFNGLAILQADTLFLTQQSELSAAGSFARALGFAQDGFTINVDAGTFVDPSQVVFSNDVTVVGDGKDVTIFQPGFDTATGGNARGWWLIEDGAEVDLSDFTMDGNGHLVWQAIRHLGSGSIDNVRFTDIRYQADGSPYAGTAVAAFGDDGPVDITNSMFDNIGRIGIQYFGAGVSGSTAQNNVYAGKGAGDWLDYGIEVGGGAANISILDNTISNNLGVASTDGSTSAGILLSTFFGAGTSAVIGGNTLSDNTTGVYVGFNSADSSSVQFLTGNQISGGANGLIFNGAGIDIVGNTLSDVVFSGQSSRYVGLYNGAEFQPGEPTVIDASAVDFDGLDLSDPNDLVTLESRIDHFADTGTDGLINFGALVVDGDTFQDSVQLAVNLAGTANIGNVVIGVNDDGDGSYGGSVEVWVDQLKISGADGATVDASSTDPFSNFGPGGFAGGAGFVVTDITGTGNGSAVTGVNIDPIAFVGTGTEIGIQLGTAASAARNSWVVGNSFDNLATGILSVNTIRGTRIFDNTMTNITGDGIHFADAVIDDERVLIRRNDIQAADTAIEFAGTIGGTNTEVEILRNILGADGTEVLNGILFQRINSAAVTISGGSIHSGGGAGPVDGDGINFRQGLHSGANVNITDVTIVSDSDEAVDFHQTIRSGAQAHINGGSYTGGNNGVEFGAIAGTATITGATIDGQGADKRGVNLLGSITGMLEIADSTITGTDDGIGSNDDQNNTVNGGTFRVAGSTVTGTNGDGIELGAVTNGATVDVSGNPEINGGTHGVNFTGVVSDSTVNVSENNAGIFAAIHGILFGGALTNSDIDILDNIIVAGTQANANGDGVHVAATVDGSHIEARRNDITVGQNSTASNTTHDGFYFGGDIVGTSVVVLRNNEIDIANAATGASTSFGDMGIRFDGFINTNGGNNADIRILDNVINAGIGAEDRGISFWNGVGGASRIEILRNTIAAGDDGIGVFDIFGANQQQSIRGNAYLLIQDNQIGTAVTRVGLANAGDGNGIDFQRVTGDAHVVIDDNAIFAFQNAIEFDKLVDTGYDGPGAGVEITNNSHIDSSSENGISFEGGVTGSSILIQNNNAGIFAADNGIEFGTVNGGALLDIYGNIIQANLDNASYGAGIAFLGAVHDATVNIGSGGSYGPQSNVIAVLNNTSGSGDQNGLDGIRFHGMVGNGAVVSIDNNRIGYTTPSLASWPTVQALGGVADDGIQFVADVTGNADIRITDNKIHALDEGIEFGGVVEEHAYVQIGGWRDGNGIWAGDNGIQFSDRITDWSQVVISHNFVRAGGNGILFEGATNNVGHGDYDIAILSNDIVGHENGILFEGDVHGYGHDVLIGWNGLIQGLDGDGIRFEDDIDDEAAVRIVYNTWIKGSDDGIDFDNNIEDGAYVKIWGNDFILGYDGDGIQFSDGVDDATVLVGGNYKIWGDDDGIGFNGAVEDGAFVKIWDNRYVLGYDGDGIEFGEEVDDATVLIADNYKIWGERNGIEFEDVVEDGSFVKIWDNRSIIGDRDDGIAFNGVLDYDTDVVIHGNRYIIGGDNGIHFGQAASDYLRLSLLGFGGGWAIDQAEVTISDNHLIKGEDENGIWVEGVRGSGYGFRYDNPNLAIVHNNDILGHENGILISRVIEAGEFYDPYSYDWGFRLSGWAVENAEVLIGWNDEIRGYRDDGIQIQGIHSALELRPVRTQISGFDGGYRLPSTEVSIIGNDEIKGHDNGINLLRGFDLTVYDLEFGTTDSFDTASAGALSRSGPNFELGDLGSLLGLLPEEARVDLTFSAWAIENADVTIAWNDEIRGYRDDGIFVGGIHSVQPILEVRDNRTVAYDGGGWTPTASASLVIHDNDRIKGHDNGINLGRGIDVGIDVEYDFAQDYAKTLTSEYSLAAELDFGAWAIDDATVLITKNGRIIGEEDNGIRVGGVRDGGQQGQMQQMLTTGIGGPGGGFGHGPNLLIAGNGLIQGHDNGIALLRGFSFDSYAYGSGYGDSYGGTYYSGYGRIAFDAYAIEDATVRILDNREIRGEHDDGIYVGGIVDNGSTLRPTVALTSSGYDGGGFDRTELRINGNHLIAGRENGIALDHGYEAGLYADLTYDDTTLLTDVTDFASVASRSAGSGLELPALDAFDLFDGSLEIRYAELWGSAIAINRAEVEIADNDAILGHYRNGILVNGVFDDPYFEQRTALVGAGHGGGSSDWNLDIHDNGWIGGGSNGILIDHGYRGGLSLYQEYLDQQRFEIATSVYTYPVLGIGFDAWAISGANVRIADNWAITGLRGNGIQVNGVSDYGTRSEGAFFDDDEESKTFETVVPVYVGPEQPNLLIERNTTIAGGNDGINFGTGFGFGLTIPLGFLTDTGLRSFAGEASVANLGGGFDGGFGLGHSFGQSVSGGYVVIDQNGAASYVDGGDPYDPDIPVILSELDFAEELRWKGDIGGRVIGIRGDGIDFTGAVTHGSTVQIQRNMLTGSGDNGIEFANIGGPVLFEGPTEPGDSTAGGEGLDLLYFDEEYEDYGQTNVFVHNNFILDNGQNLVEEEEFEETPTEQTVSLASIGHHNVTGAGILFEQGVGSNGHVEVFQNYIAGNGGPGIQVGFPALSGETDSIEARFLSDYGYDGPISAENLEVVHNYIPGPVDLEDDRPNGTFAIANYANDGSILFAQENWWGTTSPAGVIASFTGTSPIDFTSYLADGVDSNEERAPGLTGLSPFAFQPGDVFVPSIVEDAQIAFLAQALLQFFASQTNPDLAPGDRLAGRSDRDATNVFDNLFGNPYGFLDANSNLAGLAPAAGGEGCRLVGVSGGVRLTCGGGGGAGAGGLAGLAPAAGGQNGGSGAPQGGPAFAPSLSEDLQNLLDMWLGLGLGAQPVAEAGATPDQQAALMVPALQVATLQ